MTATSDKLARPTRPSHALGGRVAIVTGSASGIGFAIVSQLAGQGAAVVINGLGYGPAMAAMAGRAIPAPGSSATMVNHAGIDHAAPVDAFAPEKCGAVAAINLFAPLRD